MTHMYIFHYKPVNVNNLHKFELNGPNLFIWKGPLEALSPISL